MSAGSSAAPSGWKSEMTGRVCGLRGVRSHAFRRTRCLIDLTTEGSALQNSIELAEFDDVARRDAAGCAMKEVAIDDGAKFRHRQLVASAHQIPDLEATILADGLQRRDDVSDVAAVGERQQHPVIG